MGVTVRLCYSYSYPDTLTLGMAGIEGVWTGQDVKVEIKSEGPNTWKLSAKVANNMGCTVTKDGDTFKSSPVMCTRMMPPPDLQEKENTLSKILSELTGIKVEGSQLCLSGGSCSMLLDPA